MQQNNDEGFDICSPSLQGQRNGSIIFEYNIYVQTPNILCYCCLVAIHASRAQVDSAGKVVRLSFLAEPSKRDFTETPTERKKLSRFDVALLQHQKY